ncbi:MAG: glyoxylate/hydroxypyruvate reductase A [Bacteroidetes bacterium]|jgi:glyoxylate/hydroxypyruvate reductase A|nr:glyoxylate/hydroxypyruvate reductase A [Bacteroidota bacterium]
MSILLISKTKDLTPFRDALLALDNNLDVEIWPDISSKERVTYAVAWNQQNGLFSLFPNLNVISSLGAGVDHLIQDNSIPEHVEITRVVAPGLTEQMCDFVTMSVLNMIRDVKQYHLQQSQARWNVVNRTPKNSLKAGVMGLGELGERTAIRLVSNGFRVSGWSRTKKSIDGVTTYSEEELDRFLADTNILICLLPLTSETTDILSLKVFKQLKKPAFLLNAARGEHLVEEDLLYALDMNLLEHAALDVFKNEPLPDSHPFWSREKITITPHIASVTDPHEIANLILDNYKRMLSRQELNNRVDRQKEY